MKTVKKRILKPIPPKGRKITHTEYPENETVQSDTQSVRELYERFERQQETQPGVYFNPENLERIGRFLRPDLDLTDLDELRDLNAQLQHSIDQRAEQIIEERKKSKQQSDESDAPPPPDDSSASKQKPEGEAE